jgi:hypothetical protein
MDVDIEAPQRSAPFLRKRLVDLDSTPTRASNDQRVMNKAVLSDVPSKPGQSSLIFCCSLACIVAYSFLASILSFRSGAAGIAGAPLARQKCSNAENSARWFESSVVAGVETREASFFSLASNAA